MSQLQFALFTGCTAKSSAPELLESTYAVAQKLGIELVELHEASCCGASHIQDYDEFFSILLNARNLCYAEKLGLNVVTICNTCQMNMAQVNEQLKTDAILRAKVNEKLAEIGLEFRGSITVKQFHYMLLEDFGIDNLARAVEKPMHALSLAPFYGCHTVKSNTTHQQQSASTDDPFKPVSLERIIDALGATTVEYASKRACCGFHVDLQAPQTALKMTGDILLDAMDKGADAVVTPCPLCHLNLDAKQKKAAKQVGREIHIPVLHLPQVIGLALGIDSDTLGLKHNITPPAFAL